jgi:hypothetical protein
MERGIGASLHYANLSPALDDLGVSLLATDRRASALTLAITATLQVFMEECHHGRLHATAPPA